MTSRGNVRGDAGTTVTSVGGQRILSALRRGSSLQGVTVAGVRPRLGQGRPITRAEGRSLRRISTPVTVLASTAFAASLVLGGAGVAGAQSSDSLMPEAPEIAATVAGDAEAIGGTITNNTDADEHCHVVATDRGVVEQFEALVGDGVAPEDAFLQLEDQIQAANDEGRNAIVRAVPVPAGETVSWEGQGYEPVEDPESGAIVTCGGPVGVAYEDEGTLGSLEG